MFLHKNNLSFVFLFGIIILALLFLLNKQNHESEVVKGGSDEPIQNTKTESQENTVLGSNTEINQEKPRGERDAGITYEEKKRQKLESLQALLDDEEKHDEALKLALSMVDKGDAEQKLAAIETFNWIGGHEAKMALVALLDYGGIVSENATSSLIHLFQEDAQDSERTFDEEAFIAALDKMEETERDALFVMLNGYPVETAAPVLINLMDSQNEALRNQVFETFESMAEGTEITSKADAEEWLKKFLAESKED
ncbi:MAG: hypothetical protein IKP00_12285 [Victivallales bacterium]|nr:hypothetical protein [Victivallales bacterium]